MSPASAGGNGSRTTRMLACAIIRPSCLRLSPPHDSRSSLGRNTAAPVSLLVAALRGRSRRVRRQPHNSRGSVCPADGWARRTRLTSPPCPQSPDRLSPPLGKPNPSVNATVRLPPSPSQITKTRARFAPVFRGGTRSEPMLIKDSRSRPATRALGRANKANFDAYAESISHADF